jgi:hypothetical protein
MGSFLVMKGAKLSMDADRGFAIYGVGFLSGIECAEKTSLSPVISDIRKKPPVAAFGYANKTGNSDFLNHIPVVLEHGYRPYIFQRVVRSVAIFVVDPFRIDSMVHFVNNAGDIKTAALKTYLPVTFRGHPSSDVTRPPRVPQHETSEACEVLTRPTTPAKFAGRGFIFEALVKILRRWQGNRSLGHGSYPCFWSGCARAFVAPSAPAGV